MQLKICLARLRNRYQHPKQTQTHPTCLTEKPKCCPQCLPPSRPTTLLVRPRAASRSSMPPPTSRLRQTLLPSTTTDPHRAPPIRLPVHGRPLGLRSTTPFHPHPPILMNLPTSTAVRDLALRPADMVEAPSVLFRPLLSSPVCGQTLQTVTKTSRR